MKDGRVEGKKVRRLKASIPLLRTNSSVLYSIQHFTAFSAVSVQLKKPSGGPKGLIGPPCHGAPGRRRQISRNGTRKPKKKIIALDRRMLFNYIKEGGNTMGSINITVPGDINLEYRIENNEVVEKIIQLIKGTGEKRKTGKYQGDDDIVGIWKNRFPENMSSEMIQKDMRITTWKRY